MKSLERLIEKINHITYLENFGQKPEKELIQEFYELYKDFANNLTKEDHVKDGKRIVNKYVYIKE